MKFQICFFLFFLTLKIETLVIQRDSYYHKNKNRSLKLSKALKKKLGTINLFRRFLKIKKSNRKFDREIQRSRRRRRKLMMPGGGGGTNVVVAPSQGPGISNAQVVVNSLGTPPSTQYAGGKTVPGYSQTDADPKVIVTRIKLPGSTKYQLNFIKENYNVRYFYLQIQMQQKINKRTNNISIQFKQMQRDI